MGGASYNVWLRGLCAGLSWLRLVLCVVTWCVAIHNILSTAPQLSISQKALGTLPEDGNVIPKHVGATIDN
jgi:hypothetical protein